MGEKSKWPSEKKDKKDGDCGFFNVNLLMESSRLFWKWVLPCELFVNSTAINNKK